MQATDRINPIFYRYSPRYDVAPNCVRLSMTYVDVPTNAIRRFSLDRFCITPELIGAKHEFVFEEMPVTLRLPPLHKEEVPFDQRRIDCYLWKSAGHVPVEYQVNNVDVEIELEKTIRVPEQVLKLHPNQFNLFEQHEQKQLNKTVAETGDVAARAFELWLRVIRWKSAIGHIGEPRIHYATVDGGGAVLRERATGHRFWLQGHTITGVGRRAVTVPQWDATQIALAAAKVPPVWFDFLFDGEMRINNKDLVGGVLSLAIALEVNIRTVFSRELQRGTIEPVVLEIFDQTNLRALLNRIKKLRYWNKEWEAVTDFSIFNSLMNYRDRAMHSADTEKLDLEELKKIHAAVKLFAYFTCDFMGLS
jgi:hypothetical protein